MKIIIPLAGYGSRLRPHTYTRPKPLINVAGKPALGHLLDSLQVLENVDEYIFVVGYLGDQIEDYVKESYDFKATFIEQKELLGQSHAIALAKDRIGDEPVFVVFVDTLFEADLSIINTTDADGLIFVHEVDDPRRFGVVMLDDEQRIIKFVEKADTPPSNLAIVGMYYLKNGQALMDAFAWQMSENVRTKDEYFIADALQYMVDEGSTLKSATVDAWLDVGVPATVLSTNQHLLRQGGKANHDEIQAQYEQAILVPPVYIHPTAKIERAVIGPDVTVAANCEVTDSVVRNSIIGEGAIIHDALLGDSLIGKEAYVGGSYRAFNVGDSSTVDFASKHT